jgi:hypothetical protein
MAQGSTQPLREMSSRNLPGGKGRTERNADYLAAICANYLVNVGASTSHNPVTGIALPFYDNRSSSAARKLTPNRITSQSHTLCMITAYVFLKIYLNSILLSVSSPSKSCSSARRSAFVPSRTHTAYSYKLNLS